MNKVTYNLRELNHNIQQQQNMKKTQKRVKVLKVDPVIGSKYSQQGQHLELSCGHTAGFYYIYLHVWV